MPSSTSAARRVVVTGATGNVGTAVVAALAADPQVAEVIGVARRVPGPDLPGVRYEAADVCTADLTTVLRGADAVVHLAWAIQPSRDRATTRAVNVDGTRRVLQACATAGVGSVVYASSVGAYSPGTAAVTEDWPTSGVRSSFYSRDKADVEALLDAFEREHPATRVVRLRPALIFRREAAAEIRRLFLGPLFPGVLVRPGLLPLMPDVRGVHFQVVHTEDVAEAYRLAVVGEARGAFNIAAGPVMTVGSIGELLGARSVPVPFAPVRALAWVTWKARLQPTPPGWLDLAAQVPEMLTWRAEQELGWRPRHTGTETVRELLDGLRHGAGAPSPPLEPHAGGPLRVGEILSGLGARSPRGT